MKKIEFSGTVITGEENGAKYISLPWVMRQIKEKLGYSPYIGTLNLSLSNESRKTKKQLFKKKSISINPVEGFCVGLLFKASIEGLECAILLPQVKGYHENILEVIAPVNLREALNLSDGDLIIVSVID